VRTLLAAAASIFLGACATAPPPELNDARGAMENMDRSGAAKLAPADVQAAEEALVAAEEAYDEEGDSLVTRDLAYVAERQALKAGARARTTADGQRRAAADADAEALRDRKSKGLSIEPTDTQTELAMAQQRMAEAEEHRRAVANELLQIATVKQEVRGMVVTLTGRGLFATGTSDLIAEADAKLGPVATVLSKQDRGSRFLVEGYTDSRGDPAANDDLSRRRADVIRAFLVSRGIAADRIRAEGLGATNPIGNNDLIEGRAANRRIEIVIQNGAR
jgi:outer membrane protein OmpA-like peptidoglycan-associated protein